MRLVLTAALTATLLAATCYRPAVAEAQPPAFEQVEPGFKGVIGLGIVGAELGFILPAVAGLDETWAFIVFPIVGAAGGAIGGYFAFEQTGEVELSVAALAFGMAMIIPSMVITLAATAYDPEDEGELVDSDDEFEGEGDVDVGDDGVQLEGGGGGVEAPPPEARRTRQRHIAAAGSGLLRWSEHAGLLLGVPGLAVAPAEHDTQLHVPLLTGAF
jgi:hypothetical protein